jgi:hypothetical protein
MANTERKSNFCGWGKAIEAMLERPTPETGIKIVAAFEGGYISDAARRDEKFAAFMDARTGCNEQ